MGEPRKGEIGIYFYLCGMKTLVYTTADKALAEQGKTWLEAFGKGLHVTAATLDDWEAIRGEHWSAVLLPGDDALPSGLHYKRLFRLPEPDERHFFRLYRDELQDMVGARCSCGLFDVCHCH